MKRFWIALPFLPITRAAAAQDSRDARTSNLQLRVYRTVRFTQP